MHDDQFQHRPPPRGPSWASRATVVLIVFLAVAGLLLAYEHRVHLFTGNGLLIALLLLGVGMHFFLHRGHTGSHGDGGSRDGDGS